MKSLTFNHPASSMPRWAILEREYLRLASQAAGMLSDYLTPEGRIFWPEIDEFPAFGGVDNVFEGFQSFPLFYLLGADESMLEFARHEFQVLIEQFSAVPRPSTNADETIVRMGRNTMLVDGVIPDYDWMHHGENNLFVYHLLLADPQNELARKNITLQAQYQFGESPAGLPRNYDPENKVFASANVGANGPTLTGYDKPYEYGSWLDYYGLPYYDVPGVTTLLDLKDPEKAAKFGKVYGARKTHADSVTNLLSTSLAVNAYMVTGDTQYRDFVLDYVGAWRKRAEGQEMIPDNAGPHGIVGETMDGRFYGGNYGWTHPHGYDSIQDALVTAGEAERFFTGNRNSLDWARNVSDTLLDRYGIPAPGGGLYFPHKRTDKDSIIEFVGAPDAPMTRPDRVTDEPGFVRYKQADGWFEFRTVTTAAHWAHIYAASMDESVLDRMEEVIPPHRFTVSFQNINNKDKAGQYGAYCRYLAGRYPDYPEAVLQHSIDLFYHQAAELNAEKNGATKGFGYRPTTEQEWNLLRAASEDMRKTTGIQFDDTVVHSYYQTFLLYRSPLSAEGLLNLTMGAQAPVYNGGMIHAQLRYFDADAQRPGLPADVAALISTITEEGITLTLANTNAIEARTLIMQGGAYGEHELVSITADGQTLDIGSKWAQITIGPGTVAEMTITLKRYTNPPSLEEPIIRK